MTKRVLDVGNCVPDHMALRRLIEGSFDAVLEQSDDLAETLAAIKDRSFDLIIVNRKLDKDYSDGLAIIQHLKALPAGTTLPVMLLSNYPEYQAEAIAAGAIPGFGKQELGNRETREKLAAILSPPS
ncbi:MAG: response regulator [Planctomycetota bacterium]|nr:response regulator [Planctomycetota bacterium]